MFFFLLMNPFNIFIKLVGPIHNQTYETSFIIFVGESDIIEVFRRCLCFQVIFLFFFFKFLVFGLGTSFSSFPCEQVHHDLLENSRQRS